MSLNGLDDVKVKEAHDAAIAEPGGWFLLKYILRDEVELLGRGNGGIVEIRNAIANFEEESPLFGFLRYRRRNVLIKYVPESCSRLVQARVTVHFNAVTERFSPHDTVFPITSSKELRDTTLSNACSLHTASGSTSSSTSSLRRRRLMEIAEDAEEDKRASVVVEERPPTEKALSVSGLQASHSAISPTVLSPGEESTISFRSTVTDTDLLTPPSILPPRTFDDRPKSPTRSIEERRKSSQSTRPELHNYSSYTSSGKPKIKLGPRPSLDITGRPHTSASINFRPVSTLPAGLKLFSRSPKKSTERPQSQIPNMTPSMTLSPPPMPGSDISHQTTVLVRPHTSGGRPSSSSGASMKPPPSPTMSLMPKQPTMTPEKARLMKALQMRKKKMNSPAQPNTSPPTIPAEETRKGEDTEVGQAPHGMPNTMADTLVMLSDMAKADSGIEIESTSMEAMGGSQTTRTSSTPASPVEPSEADSTKASSVSESTDETAREHQGKEEEHPEIQQIPKPEERIAIQEAHDKLTGAIKSSVDEVQIAQEIEAQEVMESLAPEVPEVPEVLKDDFITTPVVAPPMREVAAEAVVETAPATAKKIPEPFGDLPEATEKAEENVPLVVEEMLPQSTFSGNLSPARSSMAKAEIIPAQGQTILQDSLGMTAPEEDRKVTMQDLLDAADTTPTREWKIPRSKFSVQDLKATEVAPSSAGPNSPIGSTFSNDSKRSLTDEDREEGTVDQKRKKRRGLVEPIRTDISTSLNNSDSDLDDELMDELQSAQVQEAKPMMVSKSPMKPVFPGNEKKAPTEGNRFSRALSNPFSKDSPKTQGKSKVNIPSRSVSASAAYLERINQQQSTPIVKKVNLGSGISQRIKALEKLSSASPTAAGPSAGPPVSSPSFFAVRKAGGRKSPSIAERAESLTRNTTSPSLSRESSPEALKSRERSESIQSRTNLFTSSSQNLPSRSRPESISVTARIIRDPNQPLQLKPEMPHKDPLDYSPLDLKQSPLVIDHQKAIVVPPQPKETIQVRRLSKPEQSQDLVQKSKRLSKEQPQETIKKERRSSITIIKDFISDGRNSISERRTSFSGSRKSMTIDPPVFSPSIKSPSRPPSTHTNSPGHHGRPASVSSRRSNSSRDLSVSQSPFGAGTASILATPITPNDDEAKKSGRASRMLRRMSSSISSSRKTLAHAISPTVREESEPPQTGKQSITPSQFSQSSMGPAMTIEIGDVNVQFPDTLLWKRRSMSLDSQGYLLLSQAQGNKGMERTMVNKRYHLGEFRTPFTPEMEAQELPNSVVLDFVDGSGLQIACEDRGGQARVLQVLQEAHRTWAAYGQ